ncbi:(2Fe-2S)-binding protein [Vibrio sp. HN007]|uniref:(2Fe-2S)-binding protein n=1 Tax=Vibrio iocasae TaxID=3098914 RepID=UPI0035D44AE4
MYVCLCHGISEKKLKKVVIENNFTDMREIRRCTALGSQCGKCVKHAKEILNESVPAMSFKQAS